MDHFLETHADAEVMDNGKIRCTLTGHEMPAQLEAVDAYWSGKKYRSAKAKRQGEAAKWSAKVERQVGAQKKLGPSLRS